MSEADKSEFLKQVDKALDKIRPHLAVDGGDIEVVDVTDDMQVQVKWLGNCTNCSMSAMTMKAGVEQTLKSVLPEVTGVVAVNGVTI